MFSDQDVSKHSTEMHSTTMLVLLRAIGETFDDLRTAKVLSSCEGLINLQRGPVAGQMLNQSNVCLISKTASVNVV